jgi:hypothetical protein
MDENQISQIIITSAIDVHRTLGGPGLIETIYERALEWELISKGLTVKRQYEAPVYYKGALFRFRYDWIWSWRFWLSSNARPRWKIIRFLNLNYLLISALPDCISDC